MILESIGLGHSQVGWPCDRAYFKWDPREVHLHNESAWHPFGQFSIYESHLRVLIAPLCLCMGSGRCDILCLPSPAANLVIEFLLFPSDKLFENDMNTYAYSYKTFYLHADSTPSYKLKL